MIVVEFLLFTIPLVCLSLSWMLMVKPSTSTIFDRFSLSHILFTGLALRLFCALLLWGSSNYDLESYFLVSSHVLAGEDVYSMEDTIRRHPYLPLQMYWVGAARVISDHSRLPFPFVVKWLFIAADVCLILVIFHYVSQCSTLDPKKGALLYAVNPVALYVSAYHGQFDAIPILFSILGLMAIERSVNLVGFWLGMAVWVKSFPILALPTMLLFLKRIKDKILVAFWSSFIPLLGVVAYVHQYNSSLKVVILRALSYNHGIGIWGYTYVLRLLSLGFDRLTPYIYQYFKLSRFVTLVGLTLIWLFSLKYSSSPVRTYFITLLAFLAITHAFSIQYLMWVVPLAVLVGEMRWLLRYTLAAFSYMFLVYNTLINRAFITNLLPWPQADLWIIIPASLPVWAVIIGWLLNCFIDHKRNKNRTNLGLGT